MKKDQKGFSIVEILLIVVALSLLGFIGFWVWQKNHQKDTNSSNQSQLNSNLNNQQKQTSLKSHTIENEELSFSYDPDKSVIKTSDPDRAEGSYMIRTEVKTGSSTLFITSGAVGGFGGGPFCGEAEKDICKIVDTLNSKFLGKPVTYRLIKAQQPLNCEGNASSCDSAKFTTSYAIDSVSGTGGPFGPCCSLFSAKAKNIGGKATDPGMIMVSMENEKNIQNNVMLKNKDILENIKIIESLQYKQ